MRWRNVRFQTHAAADQGLDALLNIAVRLCSAKYLCAKHKGVINLIFAFTRINRMHHIGLHKNDISS